MQHDSPDTTELVELLTTKEVWTPVDADGRCVAIEGPGMLPYLPVFRNKKGAVEFFPEHGAAMRPGIEALEKAIEEGWGVVHGVRTGISWGAAVGILMHARGEEAREFPRVADIAGMGVSVGLPLPWRLPVGIFAALRHVLGTDLSVDRAWLLALTPRGLPDEMAVLVVVAEAIAGMEVDTEDLTQRVAWASPPGDVLEAFALGSGEGPLGDLAMAERVTMWPPLYPETALH